MRNIVERRWIELQPQRTAEEQIVSCVALGLSAEPTD